MAHRGQCWEGTRRPDLRPRWSSFALPAPRICYRPAPAANRRVNVDGSVEKKKIGVLVVAYNAASTLAKVLDRIPARAQARHRRGDRQRRPQPGLHLSGGAGLPAAVRPANHLDQATDEPWLWRQPEGGLQLGHRAWARYCRHAPWRWAVRARVAPGDPRPVAGRRGRCCLWLPHHDQGCSPERRNASL